MTKEGKRLCIYRYSGVNANYKEILFDKIRKYRHHLVTDTEFQKMFKRYKCTYLYSNKQYVVTEEIMDSHINPTIMTGIVRTIN